MSSYDPSKRKPKLIFNEFGKPTLDIKEVNQYMHYQIIEALKSIPPELIEQYRLRVEEIKKLSKK